MSAHTQGPSDNLHFTCSCSGRTTVISETQVMHACLRPSQSYGFDNVSTLFERVQIDPKITKGAIRYNWFRHWNSVTRAKVES